MVSEIKKNGQKQLKQDEQIEEDQDITESLEISDNQQKELLNKIAEMQIQKKQNSRKSKERKIMEFKFRTLELLDIYVSKSNNVQLLFDHIFPLLDQAFVSQNYPIMQNYSKKLLDLLRKFFDKVQNQDVQYDTKEIIIKLLQLLHKTKEKHVQKSFQSFLMVLIKKSQIVSLEEEFVKCLRNFANNRQSQYNIELISQLIKEKDIRKVLMPQLINYANFKEFGGTRDIQRKMIVTLLTTALRVEDKSIIQSVLQENQDIFIQLIKNYLQNLEKIKKKKQQDIQKFILMVKLTCNEQLIQTLKQNLSEDEKYDSSLNQLVKKQIQKL